MSAGLSSSFVFSCLATDPLCRGDTDADFTHTSAAFAGLRAPVVRRVATRPASIRVGPRRRPSTSCTMRLHGSLCRTSDRVDPSTNTVSLFRRPTPGTVARPEADVPHLRADYFKSLSLLACDSTPRESIRPRATSPRPGPDAGAALRLSLLRQSTVLGPAGTSPWSRVMPETAINSLRASATMPIAFACSCPCPSVADTTRSSRSAAGTAASTRRSPPPSVRSRRLPALLIPCSRRAVPTVVRRRRQACEGDANSRRFLHLPPAENFHHEQPGRCWPHACAGSAACEPALQRFLLGRADPPAARRPSPR